MTAQSLEIMLRRVELARLVAENPPDQLAALDGAESIWGYLIGQRVCGAQCRLELARLAVKETNNETTSSIGLRLHTAVRTRT